MFLFELKDITIKWMLKSYNHAWKCGRKRLTKKKKKTYLYSTVTLKNKLVMGAIFSSFNVILMKEVFLVAQQNDWFTNSNPLIPLVGCCCCFVKISNWDWGYLILVEFCWFQMVFCLGDIPPGQWGLSWEHQNQFRW